MKKLAKKTTKPAAKKTTAKKAVKKTAKAGKATAGETAAAARKSLRFIGPFTPARS